MKKIGLTCIATFTCLLLVACGNQSTKKNSSSSKATSSKVVKRHKKKQSSSSNPSSAFSNSSSQDNNQQSTQSTQTTSTQQQQPQQPSQGEINRQRGVDPNGNQLLPGQDHAAGSNPDGSPDAWVQWQIDHQNDTTFPDGTPFPNGGNQDNNQQ